MGTLQGEFDRCYAYQAAVRVALDAVKADWADVLAADATALASMPQDDWDAWLAALDHGFDDAHEPAGLDAAGQAAYVVDCEAIQRLACGIIRQRAVSIQSEAVERDRYVEAALQHLTAAKTAFLAGTTLDARWLINVLMGVHLGLCAGGSDAFEGADQTLFNAARNFARDNAARLLEVIDATADRPSDAHGLQIFREARERLVAFVTR